MDINVIGKSLYSWLIVTLERCKGIFLVNHKVRVNGTGYNCRGQKDDKKWTADTKRNTTNMGNISLKLPLTA